ncbi:MAG: efflux RND transporter permease subunit, partial [Pseudomonadota bacterium]
AALGLTISNIVMFGLILAVGMLVDGAIVVVEYADRRISQGSGPMKAYTEAAKRMFWPVVASTATTLCAFLPMLLWPGVPGEFMGMLPVTLIFVLSASLIVALVYLPVLGGVSGRVSRVLENSSARIRPLPWIVRAGLAAGAGYAMIVSILQVLNPDYLVPGGGMIGYVLGALGFLISAFALSITLGAIGRRQGPKKVRAGYRRSPFGQFVNLIVGNPIGPVVAIGAVGFAVVTTFGIFAANNNGVEFFVESELENANIYIRARGNLSLEEKDALLLQAEEIVLATPGIQSAFSFAGDGGLSTGGPGGAGGPVDTIGQIQVEMVPWEDRPTILEPWFDLFGRTIHREIVDPSFDGDMIGDTVLAQLRTIPGIKVDLSAQDRGPAQGKPVHLRLRGENWDELQRVTRDMSALFAETPGLIDIDDTLPLPGIDWEIDVDVEKAGRFGADVATVGAMVQLVTRGILLDTMRVDSSDEEIEIRVRLPEEDRVLSTLDTLKVRTTDGLVPLDNFIERRPVPQLAKIDRVDGERYFDVKADVAPGLVKLVDGDGSVQAVVPADQAEGTDLTVVPVTASERIEALTAVVDDALPDTIGWEWTGDQEEQAESAAFLQTAFMGALGLMFIILLAQFNSIYNAVLVLLAVVLSTTGVLVGMLVMNQPFSIIMTGTGIVALAGIVVNNNIVLIDTYQDYARYMPRLEAITRTAEDRIRPVLLTTLTTMAGLAPMMFGLSFNFFGGGYSIGSPTALWWIQLATAVVWGLGIATVLTLLFTPAMLAARVWVSTYAVGLFRLIGRLGFGRASQAGQDWALRRAARRIPAPLLIWDEDGLGRPTQADGSTQTPLPAAASVAIEPDEPAPDDDEPHPPLRAAE